MMAYEIEFNRLVELFQDAGYEPRSYSGRGMYGKECLAVSCENPVETVLDVIWAASNIQEVERVVTALRGSRTDSLGRSEVLYFPNVEWETVARTDDATS